MVIVNSIMYYANPIYNALDECSWPKKSLWRNRLARSAVNRKVGGSSPPRDDCFVVVCFVSTQQFMPNELQMLINRR